ncbi:pilus assembly protein TadG-related protein [Galbitalea soli]|uniref:Putative Flp pilus-assembly TadG-like N-terminal domain-containing protein n=1 Tax=Galbitalea soli TaxID=1268042 RepID=A0A7C9TPD2_9MICO|nr:hypothetical protein [Galbitalea soli]NYJ31251.1 hypothetical protein [Galbitalea soli]
MTDDHGSTLPLTAFFCALALTVVLLVAGATSLYLERKRLFTVADGAALAAAETFRLTDVPHGPVTPSAPLRSDRVDSVVRELLRHSAPMSLPGLRVVRAEAIGGSASVTLSAWWRPPIVSPILGRGIRIEVTSVARSVFH